MLIRKVTLHKAWGKMGHSASSTWQMCCSSAGQSQQTVPVDSPQQTVLRWIEAWMVCDYRHLPFKSTFLETPLVLSAHNLRIAPS